MSQKGKENIFQKFFKNKTVLYITIGVIIVIIGIVVWGIITNWKFWNYSKKNNYPYIPDNVPVKHTCHKFRCRHCNQDGTVCEECLSGYIKDSKNNCVHEKKCDQDCLNCSDDGQKCLQCKGDLVLGKNGRCCQNLSKDKDGHSVCCEEQIDDQCCPPNTKNSKNPITANKRCCLSGINGVDGCCDKNQSLSHVGKCCNKDKLCANNVCCNSDETCIKGKCMLTRKCNNGNIISCVGSSQEIDVEACVCKDLECQFNQNPPKFPRTSYEGDQSCSTNTDCLEQNNCVDNKCQFRVYGITNKNNNEFQKGKYFLFNNGEILEESQKMVYQEKRTEKDLKNACLDSDCTAIKIPGAVVNNNFNTHDGLRYCLTEIDAPDDSTGTPLCPFANKDRCCMKDNIFTGQVCDQGNTCIIRTNSNQTGNNLIGECEPTCSPQCASDHICLGPYFPKCVKWNEKTGANYDEQYNNWYYSGGKYDPNQKPPDGQLSSKDWVNNSVNDDNVFNTDCRKFAIASLYNKDLVNTNSIYYDLYDNSNFFYSKDGDEKRLRPYGNLVVYRKEGTGKSPKCNVYLVGNLVNNTDSIKYPDKMGVFTGDNIDQCKNIPDCRSTDDSNYNPHNV